MDIRCVNPECEQVLRAKMEWIGSRGRCPTCRTEFTIESPWREDPVAKAEREGRVPRAAEVADALRNKKEYDMGERVRRYLAGAGPKPEEPPSFANFYGSSQEVILVDSDDGTGCFGMLVTVTLLIASGWLLVVSAGRLFPDFF